MGLRSGLSIVAIVLALLAAKVSALGLGDITLKSNLNQPLRAEITLLEARGLSESEILVSLATQADFDRIGVDRVYFLTDLRFTVDLNGRNGPVILVESKKLVREPYLNFVVLAQWPTGKLLREYTVLMDLPVFAEQAPAAVQAPVSRPPVSSAPAPAQRQAGSQANPRSSFPGGRQQASSGSSRPAPVTNRQSSYAGGDEYQIRSNDTLWEIALAVRPDTGVSVHQAMISLKQSNPDAFINNNINLLKKGEILRIPNRDQMIATSKSRAVNEFAQLANVERSQNNEVSAAPLEGRRSVDRAPESSSSAEGRVKLSSPDSADSSVGASSSGSDNQTSVNALEGELAATMEELDRTNRENSEMKSKISSLEEQIQTMERMVQVSNEKMAALELSAQKTQEQTESAAQSQISESESMAEELIEESALEGESLVESETVVPSAIDTAIAEFEEEGSEAAENLGNEITSEIDPQEGLGELAAAQGQATPEAVVETPKPAPTAAPVKAPPVKATSSILDMIMDNIVYVGLGALAVIGLLVLVLKKLFSKDEIDDDEDFLSPATYEESESDSLSGDDLDDMSDELAIADAEDVENPGDSDEDFDVLADEDHIEENEVEPQTEDVVAEADIYIAYGKYDQAEEMLLRALEAEPAFHDARLKLLETYAAQQNVESFDPHFANIVATNSDELIERGQQLRSSIADAPEFRSADYDTSDFEELLGFDTSELGEDIEAELGDDSTVVNFRGNVAANADDELDIDLAGLDNEELEADVLDDVGVSDTDNDDQSIDVGSEFNFGTDQDDSFDLDIDDSSEDSDSEVKGLDLDLGDDDFDLGELNLTDELDDNLEGEIDTSIDQVEELDTGFEVDLDSLLDTPDSEDVLNDELEDGLSEFTDKNDKLDIAGDLDETLLNQAVDVEDGLDELPASDIDAISKADTLVFGVDDSLQNLKEAESRESVQSDSSEESSDFDLDDDLDLSSLDSELEALSKDLDGELDEDSVLKELDDDDITAVRGDSDSFDLGADLDDELDKVLDTNLEDDFDTESTGSAMEEPLTDFDELDIEVAEDRSSNLDDVDLDNNETQIGIDTVSSEDNLDSDDDFLLPDIDPDSTDEDDLDFLTDSDETATKLDLARAYIDMGDEDGAKDILDEIVKEGSDDHKKEANDLMARIEA